MRFLLSYGCQKKMLISQCAISSAYLQSVLDEDVFMAVPPDMMVDGKPPRDAEGRELCIKLKKGLSAYARQAIYGSKPSSPLSSARRWDSPR